MRDRLYRVQKRVYWSDTDAGGIVYFANFLRYFEEVEDELFRALGRPRDELSRELGIFMPRVESHCRFRSPARAGDLLDIGVDVEVVNPRRLLFRFEARLAEDGRLVADASYRVACTTQDFQPVDFPPALLELLARR